MPSERTRKILPYISIAVGILVYILYYYSTENWKQAQSDYERKQVAERQAKKRADQQYLKKSKPWISIDGKEIYKIKSREEKDGLTWIQLNELKENINYNLRYVASASGEKYTSNAGNIFWIKGDEAFFENSEKEKSILQKTKIFKGLYSYMADANSYQLCDTDRKLSIAMTGENIKIEQAYSKLKGSGENVYLEIEGAIILEESMEGSEMINAIYPYQMIELDPSKNCN